MNTFLSSQPRVDLTVNGKAPGRISGGLCAGGERGGEIDDFDVATRGSDD